MWHVNVTCTLQNDLNLYIYQNVTNYFYKYLYVYVLLRVSNHYKCIAQSL